MKQEIDTATEHSEEGSESENLKNKNNNTTNTNNVKCGWEAKNQKVAKKIT